MLSKFFLPTYHFGVPFDNGMQLFEFSAMRSPEKERFPLIGEFCRQHCEFVRIPHPQVLSMDAMPYDGFRYLPDFFISNNTKLWGYSNHNPKTSLHPSKKATFSNEVDYEIVSIINNGGSIHSAAEAFCRKVTGLPSSQIVAKYHRAVWLPCYWPETLGTIWDTPFWYPAKGYAGALAEILGTEQRPNGGTAVRAVEIRLAYCLCTVATPFSVLFIPELRRRLADNTAIHSPIYRITDQDVCAGTDSEVHRLVVEYRGECDVAADLAVLGITVQDIAYGKGRIVPPTRENVEAGYDFGNHMNAQILEMMNARQT